MTIEIATASSRNSTNWRNVETTWADFIERLRKPKRTAETAVQYHTGTKEFRDNAKDVGGFVGGNIQGGRRTSRSILYRTLVTLDLDNADADTLEQIRTECDGWAWVVYSTHSHTEDKPRLRLILPLDREVTTDEYQAIARRIAGDAQIIEVCDDSTYQPERLMYWPSVSQDAPYLFEVGEGEPVCASQILERYDCWQDYTEWPHSSRATVRLHKSVQAVQDPTTKDGVVGAFCRAYTISDVMRKYLRHVYEPGTDPRKTNRYSYKLGSTRNGVEVHDDKHAYSYHGTDPACGQLLNAYDLVRVHLFGDLDAKCDPRTNIVKRPSYIAMQELAQREPAVRKDMMRQIWGADEAESDDDGWDDSPSAGVNPSKTSTRKQPSSSADEDAWMGEVDMDKKGNVRPTIQNIYLILCNDPEVKDRFYLDTFSARVIVSGDLPWERSTSKEWDDSDDAGLRRWLEDKYNLTGTAKIADAYDQCVQRSKRNPVKEYIEAVKWDGAPRLDTVLVDYLGAPDTPLVRAITRKSLTAAVARIYEPGTKYDQITVLAGREGIGKSTLLRNLGSEWYSDTFMSVEGKEAMEQLAGAWIIEIAELTGLKKAEMTAVKAFVSKQEDCFRAAYAKKKTYRPRQCVFFGTTNESDFLRDENGNRRFWIVPVGQHEATKSPWALRGSSELAQIWAEALEAYKSGEPLYLSKSMEADLKAQQSVYAEDDGLAGIIEAYLDKELPANYYSLSADQRKSYIQGYYVPELSVFEEPIRRDYVSAVEIANECLGISGKDLITIRRIKRAMRCIDGWREGTSDLIRDKAYGRQRVFRRICE